MAEARTALGSDDPERVTLALDSLVAAGSPEAAGLIVTYLQSGPPDRLTDYAVEKLGNLAQPAALEELRALLDHRRAIVRRKAVEALAEIHDPRVRPMIESALRDSDPGVRAQAALALADTGARGSVPLLFRAFEHGVPEAAAAIGRLGEASTAVSADAAIDREDPRSTRQAHTLAMWLGRVPLSILLEGFRGFLARRDIPAAVKVQIIARLEQQASAQVRDFLQRWVASLPAGYHGPDRQRAELAIQQIRVPSGSAGGTR